MKTALLECIFILLSSLLPEFEPVITIIEADNTDDLEWSAVVRRLLNFEARMVSKGMLSASGHAAKSSEVKGLMLCQQLTPKQPSGAAVNLQHKQVRRREPAGGPQHVQQP